MIKSRQPFSALIPLAAVSVLFVAFVCLDLSRSHSTAPSQDAVTTTAPQHAIPTDGKPKNNSGTTSVLDAEMLNNPVSYLREAFSVEEEDNTDSFQSEKVLLTLKALAASLLATII